MTAIPGRDIHPGHRKNWLAMASHWQELADPVLDLIRTGVVIPAHPLALTDTRKLDERRQRALSRYYIDAGSGGLAVGVHTTQFEIREAGLYGRVLELAAETMADWTDRPLAAIAGLAGRTQQAVSEAGTARALGYHAGLLSLAAFHDAGEDEVIDHCARVAQEIPIVGFYLQPAVGGRDLPASFWRRFAAIDNVIAIKAAPFNRYRTLDVLRGVVEAEAENRITIYTGNDDHIVFDLLAPFALVRDDEQVQVRIKGGLLGHWSVWTKRAVEQLGRIHAAVEADSVDASLLALDARVTDCNSAFFDVANDFRGCIAGCHEVLRRQGLLQSIACLNPDETLSPGQAEEIDRVYASYPDLNDDDFVAANLERWLA